MTKLTCPNCNSENVILDEYTPLENETPYHFAQYHCEDCGAALVEDKTEYSYYPEYDAYGFDGSEHGVLLLYPGNWQIGGERE